jgi:hypothetical protein
MATASTMQDQEEKSKEEKLYKYLGIALEEYCNVSILFGIVISFKNLYLSWALLTEK